MQLFVSAATQLVMKVLRYKIILLYLLLESISGFTQNMAIGEWRIAVPYSNVRSLTDGKDFVYAAANVFYFGYHKTENYPATYDKVNGLSDVDVSIVAYHSGLDVLLVAYENTNIDLVYENKIVNISDIKRSSITGKKTINSVYFSNNLAYISCGFGIIVLDLDKQEIQATYYIGNNGTQTEVFATTIHNNELFAATAIGLQKVDLNVSNPANYLFWENTLPFPASDVETFNNQVYAVSRDTLFIENGSNWNTLYSDTSFNIINIRTSGNRLLICETDTSVNDSRISAFDGINFGTIIPSGSGYGIITDALFVNDTVMYVADLFTGLYRVMNGARESLVPNGPGSENIARIAIRDDRLLYSNGSTADMFVAPVLSQANSGWWYNLTQYNTPGLEPFPSIIPVVFNPSGNKVYLGSYNHGIVELDIASGAVTDTFTVYNSSMETTVGDPSRCKVPGIAFDEQGNMWATNFGANKFLAVRKTDGTWQSFKPVNVASAGSVTDIIVDDYGQKWMLSTGSGSDGIVVFSEGQDFAIATDDVGKVLRKGAGLGNLPSNNVLAIANDLEGEIWVGTDAGIAVFYCAGSVLGESGCDAQEILVTAEDGFVGALLGSERVQTIAVDGANRKWVGTTNGVWLFSPDGTKQIHYFSTENSPLISNNITTIAIDPKDGLVYIGTDKGLMIYRSDATEGEPEPEEDKVLAFPNPVRENYQGPIAIKGLARDADVKITDVAGNLVFKTTALGGQAIWDGKDGTGSNIKGGVYLVFSADSEGNSKLVTKVLVMR